MNREVFIAGAGAGDTTSKHVPIALRRIADASIEAAKAGATRVTG